MALDALTRTDYQLILTAARALADKAARAEARRRRCCTRSGASPKEHKDTSRDPRMAILDRLQALGDASAGREPRGLPEGFRSGDRRARPRRS